MAGGRDHVGQASDPLGAQQDRHQRVGRQQQGAQRQGSLDDEDPVLALGPHPQGRVGKTAV